MTAYLENTYINLKNNLYIAMQNYKRDQTGRFTDEQIKTQLLKQGAITIILVTIILRVGFTIITR